jgi:ferric-dicitrate binding protein FerR (iron transport regulator)
MRQSERIGVLLFLHLRNELSDDEKTELSAWRDKAPENEQLFRETNRPDFMRKTLSGYFRRKDEVFKGLEQQFPYLADPGFSTELGFEDVNSAGGDYRGFFPDKQLSESGLSKPEFWKSMIPDMLLSGDDNINEEIVSEQPSRDIGKRSFIRSNRILLISLLTAASIVLGITYYFGGFDFESNVNEAFMLSPDGNRYLLNEFNRGRLAGLAGIRFGRTNKGERVWIFTNRPKYKNTDSYTLETSAGKGFILQLPDGSRVWMNSKSAISYPANFSQDTIMMNLEGEAFFELAKQASHHYIIRSEVKGQGITVRDVGVRNQGKEFTNEGLYLNISSYSTDSGFQVTLVGGTADITNRTSLKDISLLSGQQVILNNGNEEVISVIDTTKTIAWKNGEFDFKDLAIQQIMPELERWYDLKVDYQSNVPDKRFSLQVPRSASLPKVLGILERQGVHIRKNGRKLIITF